MRALCLTFDEPLDWDAFHRWLAAVRANWADRLLRVKGVLNVVGESQPLVGAAERAGCFGAVNDLALRESERP